MYFWTDSQAEPIDSSIHQGGQSDEVPMQNYLANADPSSPVVPDLRYFILHLNPFCLLFIFGSSSKFSLSLSECVFVFMYLLPFPNEEK